MTDKELRRLKRSELMELLLLQSKEADEQNSRLAALQEQLERRDIKMENTGSIAEAALQVNQVFEAAQAAADQYLENLADTEVKCREMEEASRRKCIELEQMSQARCRETEEKRVAMEREAEECLQTAQEQARKLQQEAEERIARLEEEAKKRWTEAEEKNEKAVRETRLACRQMLREAEQQVKEYWETVEKNLNEYVSRHEDLEELLQSSCAEVTVNASEAGEE